MLGPSLPCHKQNHGGAHFIGRMAGLRVFVAMRDAPKCGNVDHRVHSVKGLRWGSASKISAWMNVNSCMFSLHPVRRGSRIVTPKSLDRTGLLRFELMKRDPPVIGMRTSGPPRSVCNGLTGRTSVSIQGSP